MIEFNSEENIRQAWKKIRNYYYYYDSKRNKLNPKDKIKMQNIFQFNEIDEFYNNQDKRLDFLIERVTNDTYEPEISSKFYIPKSKSGLRPFVVLSAEDLILYQCFINVFSELYKSEFDKFGDNTIFSNIPAPYQSTKITYYWLRQLKKFNMKVDEKLEDGKLVLHTDITSFYTEISHSLLKALLTEKCEAVNDPIAGNVDYFFECLRIWTNPENPNIQAGIPQGLPQSHILANIFLFPVDNKLIGQIEYIRWVDDFRIFGGSNNVLEKSLIELDHYLREFGLLIKESKTFLVRNKLIDPFKSFENDVKGLVEDKKEKEKIKFSDILVSIAYEEGHFAKDEDNETENSFDNSDIIENFLEVEREFPDDHETNFVSSSELFYILKKIDSTKLFEVCKQHIFDCLGNIFTEKEITDYFYKNAPKDLPSIQSKITIETPDLLIERYSRKLNFLYKTIIPTINKYDDVTFFILLRLCDFNPLHIGLFYPFFETAINSREVSDNLKNQLRNWLIGLLEPKQPIDYLKYYSLEILDADADKDQRVKIEDLVRYYITDNNTSWFLKYRNLKSYLLGFSQKTEGIQFCLAHYSDQNNSFALKLSLAKQILQYRSQLDLLKTASRSRSPEIQELFNKTVAENNSSLNLFAVKLKDTYQSIEINEQILTGVTYKKFIKEIDYTCSIRHDLMKLFIIKFPSRFSFRDLIDGRNKLQPSYDLINRMIKYSIRAKHEQRWEVYINSIVAVIESLLFTLYTQLGLNDDKNKIKGFVYHKRILNQLFTNDKFNWDELIDNIGEIRNRNLLSHIRDIRTSDFNPFVGQETLKKFNELSQKIIQYIVDLFNIDIPKENIDKQNDLLARENPNFQKYYEEVKSKIRSIKKYLLDIESELDSIDK